MNDICKNNGITRKWPCPERDCREFEACMREWKKDAIMNNPDPNQGRSVALDDARADLMAENAALRSSRERWRNIAEVTAAEAEEYRKKLEEHMAKSYTGVVYACPLCKHQWLETSAVRPDFCSVCGKNIWDWGRRKSK